MLFRHVIDPTDSNAGGASDWRADGTRASFHGSSEAPLGKSGVYVNVRVFRLLEALFMSNERRPRIGARTRGVTAPFVSRPMLPDVKHAAKQPSNNAINVGRRIHRDTFRAGAVK